MKTYVLILSTKFPLHHPKSGKPTFFEQKLMIEMKKHTIRNNYDLWSKRIDEVNAGKAEIHVRKWSDKPYGSKQAPICILTKASYQRVGDVKAFDFEIAENDGLSLFEFAAWFKSDMENVMEVIKDCIIIHFTEFKYIEKVK